MAGETLVVADASVVVKWFVEEEQSDAALRLRDDYVDRALDIASPDLLPYEVLNALRYNPAIGEKQLKQIATALEKYSLWLHPMTGELAATTIENALAHGISVYDSAYISLGLIRDTVVYTADQRLIDKTGHERLRHISTY
jgi:predicted nucleic acid-binding protein